jgi:hypothetical protein
MIIVVNIYNKEIGWYALSRDDYINVATIPRGLIVLPSLMINFVEVGAKSRLWS